MTTKHTPGPWTIDDFSIRDANGYDILRVGVDACDNPFFSFGSDEAQFRIMAAPAMYAALKAVLEDLGAVRGMDPDTTLKIKAALAEAETK